MNRTPKCRTPLCKRHMSCPARASHTRAGFSLVELIVVVGIFAVLTAVVLANHGKFRGGIVLSNLAYDMALSIRQAQIFGIGVREAGVGAGGDFDTSYGIHFDANDDALYQLFADVNENRQFDSGESVETFTLNRGYRISKFCVVSSAGSSCTPPPPLETLDIVFERPRPDAIVNGSASRDASITVRAPGGDERGIEVLSTGQITVTTP